MKYQIAKKKRGRVVENDGNAGRRHALEMNARWCRTEKNEYRKSRRKKGRKKKIM